MNFSTLFYIPNLIDYGRIALLYFAYKEYNNHELWNFAILYIISYLLDVVDGFAARVFGQCSQFGVYLDMIIDRASSSLALHIAAVQIYHRYPNSKGLFFAIFLYAVLVIGELFSHFVIIVGSIKYNIHQKKMKSNRFFSKYYLSNPFIMFWSCLYFEAFALSVILNYEVISVFFSFGFFFRIASNIERMINVFKYKASHLD